jgi:hypothetical protein
MVRSVHPLRKTLQWSSLRWRTAISFIAIDATRLAILMRVLHPLLQSNG